MDTEKVMVFIDGANVYKTAKKLGYAVSVESYEKIVNNLVGQRKLVRIYFYTAIPDQTRESQSYRKTRNFLRALESRPFFEIRLGRICYPDPGKPFTKGVDVKLATDMLEYANRGLYDTAILVSGDGDFAYVLPFIKDKGKHIVSAFFLKDLSFDLRQKADIFVEIQPNWLK